MPAGEVCHHARMPSPEPYWSDDLVTLYRGDALEVLPTIAAGSVTAVVTDPPYVIGAVSAGNIGSKAGGWADMMNSALWFSTWYRAALRTLKHRGSFWTFCNWRSLPVVMRAAIDVDQAVTSTVVWDKMTIGPGGSQGLRPQHELIALMARPDFAIPDRGVPDVWAHPAHMAHKPHGHPAEKPEGLLRRILEVAEVPAGEVVLDPFAGSGTTLAAARALGLRAVGIEAETRWCDVIAERLSQAELFTGTA